MLYESLKFLASLLLKWFFGMEIKGKESFPHHKPFILASNHVSYLDPIVIGAACPYRLYFLAKEELFKNRLFALFLSSLGVLSLKRNESGIRGIRMALKILQRKPIAIFPQGTRTVYYDTFKSGVGFLQKKAGLPLVAAKIYGTDRILPSQAKFIRRGKIKVIFARVLDIKKADSHKEITAKALEKIKSL